MQNRNEQHNESGYLMLNGPDDTLWIPRSSNKSWLTLFYLLPKEAGLSSYEELEKALTATHEEYSSDRKEIKDLEHMISDKTEARSNLLIILNSRNIYEEYKKIKDKAKRQTFYKEHESVFIRRDAAFRYFKSRGITRLPSLKALNAEIEELISRKNEIYNSYREARAREKVLYDLVLQHVQLVTGYIYHHQDHFRRVMEQQLHTESGKQIKANRKALERDEKRIAELKRLFIKTYEDTQREFLLKEGLFCGIISA